MAAKKKKNQVTEESNSGQTLGEETSEGLYEEEGDEDSSDEGDSSEEDDGKDDAPIVQANVADVRLTEQQKLDLRQRVLAKRNEIETSYFEFAELIFDVHKSAAYLDWQGECFDDEEQSKVLRNYKNFNEWCEVELGISHRKGNYYVSMVNWFVHQVQSQEVIDKVKGLGWSKVKELVEVVTDQNVDEWVEKAESMTVSQLAKACKEAMKTGGSENESPEQVVRRSFTLLSDQIALVDSAFQHAEEVAESDKPGHLLTLICQDYMAGAVRPNNKGAKNAYLSRIETILGVQLFAVDTESGKPVFGKKLLSKLDEKGNLKIEEAEDSKEEAPKNEGTEQQS